MPTQYEPLTRQIGLPKDKSAKEQLLALMRVLGQMPTPMGMASEGGQDAKLLAEWLAKNKATQVTGEMAPSSTSDLLTKMDRMVNKSAPVGSVVTRRGGKLLERPMAQSSAQVYTSPEVAEAPKLIEKATEIAPEVAQAAPAEPTPITLETLQKMAAQAPKQTAEVPAMAAPTGGMAMEQAAKVAPKVTKKGSNKIAQQITELAGKTPSKQEVQAGLSQVGPDAMQQEFNALRELLDSARKLKAKGIESDIGNLYGDMMAGGGQRGPTSQATLDHVAMQRKLIQHQLQRLLDALAGKK